jgi:hypothetical protein
LETAETCGAFVAGLLAACLCFGGSFLNNPGFGLGVSGWFVTWRISF